MMKFKAKHDHPVIWAGSMLDPSITIGSGIANFSEFECNVKLQREIGNITYYQAESINLPFPFILFNSDDWEEIIQE